MAERKRSKDGVSETEQYIDNEVSTPRRPGATVASWNVKSAPAPRKAPRSTAKASSV